MGLVSLSHITVNHVNASLVVLTIHYNIHYIRWTGNGLFSFRCQTWMFLPQGEYTQDRFFHHGPVTVDWFSFGITDSQFHVWSHGLMVEASFLTVCCVWAQRRIVIWQEDLINSGNWYLVSTLLLVSLADGSIVVLVPDRWRFQEEENPSCTIFYT